MYKYIDPDTECHQLQCMTFYIARWQDLYSPWDRNRRENVKEQRKKVRQVCLIGLPPAYLELQQFSHITNFISLPPN